MLARQWPLSEMHLVSCRRCTTFWKHQQKRHAIFEKVKDKNFAGGSETLKSMCYTRWSCRFEAIRVISNHFDAIIKALQELAEMIKNVGAKLISS